MVCFLPEVYLGNVHTLLDRDGRIKDDGVNNLLQEFADAFADFIEKLLD